MTQPQTPSTALTTELIELVRGLSPPGSVITPQTGILAELDLDSLKMLELVDALKVKYGVDFLEAPHSIYSLRTVETIAGALSVATPRVAPL